MKTPQHIAIICDGNRRWAKSHGWEVFKGHDYAVNHIFEPLIDHAGKRGVEYLTFWIFSTENWKRDKKEVGFLMDLFRSFFDRQIKELHKKNVRVNMIGDLSGLSKDIQERIHKGMAETKDNTGITVTLAINYGGHDELRRATQAIAQKVASGELEPEAITRQTIADHLDTGKIGNRDGAVQTELPHPEMIVRTSGEQRMSGFLSWQQEYAEFYFPEWHFPEFTPEKLDEVIEEFNDRQRRFGA